MIMSIDASARLISAASCSIRRTFSIPKVRELPLQSPHPSCPRADGDDECLRAAPLGQLHRREAGTGTHVAVADVVAYTGVSVLGLQSAKRM